MKFVVVGSGDWSVGIPSSFATVSFDAEGLVWDDDEVSRVKSLLAEWDDNGTTVYTEQEYDDYCRFEEGVMLDER